MNKRSISNKSRMSGARRADIAPAQAGAMPPMQVTILSRESATVTGSVAVRRHVRSLQVTVCASVHALSHMYGLFGCACATPDRKDGSMHRQAQG